MSTPIVIVPSGGLPISEATDGFGMPVTVAANGYGIPVTVVASGGTPVVGSQQIQLSAATVQSTATVGTTIGTLSVLNGSGGYTYTFASGGNPGTLFSISGSSLQVAAALSIGSDPIMIHADNGAGSVLNMAFLITVINGAFVPTYYFLGF